MAQPTMRDDCGDPVYRAIAPYVVTLPGGINRTTS